MTDTKTQLTTRLLTEADSGAVFELFRAIAGKPGGFVRGEDEITLDYVARILRRTSHGGIAFGLILQSEGGEQLLGSITARQLAIKAFSHVLSSVVIGIHPEHQSQGHGRRLFLEFLEFVQVNRPEILRIEMLARESKPRQIAFYESIGFRREGIFERRLRGANGEFEADVPMAWFKT